MDKMVKGWFVAAAQRIWFYLLPWLEAKWVEIKPQIFAFIQEQFNKWMPQLIRAALIGAAQGSGNVASGAVDKVTDWVPGTIDDQLVDGPAKEAIDGIVGGIVNQINQWNR